MKKKVLALVILGGIMLVGGGVGAALNFSAAEKQVSTVTNEAYKIKDKKNQQALALTLDLKSDNYLNIQIVPSSDEEFHLNSKSYNGSRKPTLGWEINEKKDQTELKLSYSEKKQKESNFTIGFWDFEYTPITLAVPDNYENITISSSNNDSHEVNLDNLHIKKMVVDNNNNSINLNNIYAETLKLAGENNEISLLNVRVNNDLSLENNGGNIYLNDVVAETIHSKTIDGGIDLYDIVGETQLESEYGNINVNDIVGPLKISSGRGDIMFEQDKLKDNLELSNNSGEIRIMLDKKPTKLDLTATTSSGELSIFGKEREKAFTDKNGPKVSLTTKTGDIIMTTYNEDFDEDESFDDDF